ncbi:MAG: nitrous oxide-stimulated promoter family protein [Acidobacteriota bacterium]
MKSERRLKRERSTVLKMISLFCRGHHGSTESALCDQCESLNRYVLARLERCPFGDDKPVCDRCPIHCYRPEIRVQIKRVMQYSGPRMFLRHPILTVYHFIDAHRTPPELERSGA